MNPPPWFQAAMAECESLSLDVASDRRRLWQAIRRHLPRADIEHAISTHRDYDDCSDNESQRIASAVMLSLAGAP